MSRLSRRQHRRKELRQVEAARMEEGKRQLARSLIEMMLHAGETEGHPFQPYTGARDKVWHDIILKDGRAFLSCYPNGMGWHPSTGPRIGDEHVAYIRVCAKQPWDEESETSLPAGNATTPLGDDSGAAGNLLP